MIVHSAPTNQKKMLSCLKFVDHLCRHESQCSSETWQRYHLNWGESISTQSDLYRWERKKVQSWKGQSTPPDDQKKKGVLGSLPCPGQIRILPSIVMNKEICLHVDPQKHGNMNKETLPYLPRCSICSQARWETQWRESQNLQQSRMSDLLFLGSSPLKTTVCLVGKECPPTTATSTCRSYDHPVSCAAKGGIVSANSNCIKHPM